MAEPTRKNLAPLLASLVRVAANGGAIECLAAAEAIRALLNRVDELDPPCTTKPRVITKMAKNLTHGDVITFPGIMGSGRVNGWCLVGGYVTVTAPGQRQATFEANQRVKVHREV